jgi:MFS family permease
LSLSFRFIQGFAVAGEISGASSMILEHAPFGRRGYFASFTLQGVQAGQIFAAAVFLPLAHYMPTEAFNSYGWRIPFLLSALVIVAGYIIRRKVEETPAFAEEAEHGEIPKSPIVQAIQLSWKDILRVICMALMNVIAVVAAIFGAAYAVQPAYGIRFPKDVYLWIPIAGNIIAVFIIPYVGDLSDKIGRKPLVIGGALGSGLLSFVISMPSASTTCGSQSPRRSSCGVSFTKATTPYSRAYSPNSSKPGPGSRRWPLGRISGLPSLPCFRRSSPPWRRPVRATSRSPSVRSPLA